MVSCVSLIDVKRKAGRGGGAADTALKTPHDNVGNKQHHTGDDLGPGDAGLVLRERGRTWRTSGWICVTGMALSPPP